MTGIGRPDAPPTARPLTGTRVVVTRSRAQASELGDRLARLGASVVELPVIAIEDPVDGGAALRGACLRLAAGGFDWVACTSVNAAIRTLAALGGRAVPPSVRWAAVGVGTAQTLTAAGHPPELVPRVATSEALAEAFPPLGPSAPVGETRAGPPAGGVLFPRAEVVGGTLATALRAKGWPVEEVVAYRTVAGSPDPGAVETAARADVITFTSSSTVVRTLELLGPLRVPPMVVTIGPVTSDAARRAGLVVAREASPHTVTGVVDAVLDAVSAAGSGSGSGGRPDPGRDQ
jgi:uroporphyrinogen-III synthase